MRPFVLLLLLIWSQLLMWIIQSGSIHGSVSTFMEEFAVEQTKDPVSEGKLLPARS